MTRPLCSNRARGHPKPLKRRDERGDDELDDVAIQPLADAVAALSLQELVQRLHLVVHARALLRRLRDRLAVLRLRVQRQLVLDLARELDLLSVVLLQLR